jgi:hypothetical protein
MPRFYPLHQSLDRHGPQPNQRAEPRPWRRRTLQHETTEVTARRTGKPIDE